MCVCVCVCVCVFVCVCVCARADWSNVPKSKMVTEKKRDIPTHNALSLSFESFVGFRVQTLGFGVGKGGRV